MRDEFRATAIGLSGNGAFAALGFSGGGLALWDIERGRELVRASIPRDTVAVTASNEGAAMAALTQDGSLYWFDASGVRLVSRVRPGVAIAVDPSATTVAVAHANGGLSLIGLADGRDSELDTPRLLAVSFRSPAAVVALSETGAWVNADASGVTVSAGAGRYVAGAIAPDRNSALAIDRRGAVARIAVGGGPPISTGQAPGQVRIAVGASGSTLLGLDEAGRAAVLELRSGRRLARIVSAQRGWVVLDEAGRYDGSRGGLASADWAFNAAVVPIDTFADRYFEPGVLGRIWARGDAGAVQAQSIEAGTPVPPSVQLVLDNETPKIGGRDFQVVVLATVGGAPIAGLRLFHNGRALPQSALVQVQDVQAQGGMVRAAAFLTTPSAGLNTFSAVAETDDGADAVSPRVTERFTGAQPAATLHVLAVGVDEYGGLLPNLNFAASDASAIAERLGQTPSRAYTRVNVSRLINANASRAAILASLRQIAAVAGPDDSVVVYLAGHGLSLRTGQWSFGASGANPARLEATGVSSADVEEALRPSSVRRVAILIDACFAGAGANAFASQRATYQRVIADVSRVAGLTIIAAARDDAAALEVRSLGHGAFTYAVLQALSGSADTAPRDGSVSVLELADSIERDMGPLAQRNAAARQEARVFTIGADFPLR